MRSDRDTKLMNLFVDHLETTLQRAKDNSGEIPSATLGVIRQFLSDNSITLASIARGDFGEFAQKATEDFPFDTDGRIKGAPIMGVTTKQ